MKRLFALLGAALLAWSAQAQVFSLEGHQWATTSRTDGPLASSAALVGLDVLDLDLHGGAGGTAQQPGDYVLGNHREAYRQSGQWGILRVLGCDDDSDSLTTLPPDGSKRTAILHLSSHADRFKFPAWSSSPGVT